MTNISNIVTPINKLFKKNSYALTINNINSPLSVLSIKSHEELDQPWCYTITFTSSDKNLELSKGLSQPASLQFCDKYDDDSNTSIHSFYFPKKTRSLHGVITEYSELQTSKDEIRYQIKLQSRFALLANTKRKAIFQNQSVVEVVEGILRQHNFTGIDYYFELNQSYPMREIITQWNETDLQFIQRLLSEVGIWFRFESNNKHHCDVITMSDNEQGLSDCGSIKEQIPNGMIDDKERSIWSLSQRCSIIESEIILNDSNYRISQKDMLSVSDNKSPDNTSIGTHYKYGGGYKQKGHANQVESGVWYANIRHQQKICKQFIIHGYSNDYHLSPGQKITIQELSIEQISKELIIVSIDGYGDRTEAFQLHFTAIPFDRLKPYRPMLCQKPAMNNTLPAKITSPDNDTYGYIDTNGRYRVKFNYDLATWRAGQESLWLRLAKNYAGDEYGMHFPLIDGTEVAIAYTDGDPDRPYIAFAMPNSAKLDHVTTANNHRNVIRTAANNKLRMDDKRGQEHIKLATEYAKTQLNLGHLVNSSKMIRGEGFELRTDQWGTIAANKGLYLTTQSQPKAQGQQLDMQATISQLENALAIANALKNAANQAQLPSIETTNQTQLKNKLTQLSENGIVAYATEGIALTSDQNIQLSSAQSVSAIAQNQIDIQSAKTITVAASESINIFSHQAGIKALASHGNLEIQAQNSDMDISAKQSIKVDSVDGKITVTATKSITLICGGSYIKITSSGVELGSSGCVLLKSAAFQKMGPSQVKNTRKLPNQLDPDLLPEYEQLESDNMWFSG